MATTPGKLLLKQALPSQYHAFLEEGPLTSKRIGLLMQLLATDHPELYKQTLSNLLSVGEEVASTYGGVASLSPEAFLTGANLAAARAVLEKRIQRIRAQRIPIEEKNRQVIEVLKDAENTIGPAIQKDIQNTALGVMYASGARGNLEQIRDILAGELLPIDSTGNPIPLPITRGYAEGLTPSQYWVASQRARLGLIGVKLATPVAGDLSNQLIQAVLRLRVTEAKEPDSKAGLPIDPTDPDYEGSVLAMDIPGIAKRGDILTPRLARLLHGRTVLIHSPITSLAEYGISRQAAGSALGESFPIGAFAGITAAQALMEPFVQANIASKHLGQRAAAGVELIKQLIEAPLHFPNAAAIAEEDGVITAIDELATGGRVVKVNDRAYTVAPDVDVTVKVGDRVEKGQILSAGLPNPAVLARIRGVGEARRQFAQLFSTALENSGIPHNKRNAEYIARGLVNHVRVTEPYKQWLPGDIVEFSSVMRGYEPRETSQDTNVSSAVGLYLEEPVAQYTVGTRVSRGMAKELRGYGFTTVMTNQSPPPFEPELRRAREALQHSEDWLMRLGGSELRRSFTKALYSGQAPAKPTVPTAVYPQLLMFGAPQPVGGEKESERG